MNLGSVPALAAVRGFGFLAAAVICALSSAWVVVQLPFHHCTSPSSLDHLLPFLHQNSKPSFTVYSLLGLRRNYGINSENNL